MIFKYFYNSLSLLISLLFLINLSFAADEKFRDVCIKDIQFLKSQLQKNSAPFANESDKVFHEWYENGYKEALELINEITDKDDCYYAMKYYVNGFNHSHISLRGYISLPQEQYPGILTAKRGPSHYIFYKDARIKYLDNVSINDKVTHINGIKIEAFFEDFLLPFYANDKSELTLVSASVYALIVDGNKFKPIPKTITILHEEKPTTIDLKYMDLEQNALAAAKKLRQPEPNESFRIEMISNGVWIKIPTFFPTREEVVYFTGMLSRLKNDIAKEDYILFDMRGNRGGGTKWSIPIIRNLWGDDYLKSLGDKHDYNKNWIKKIRISKENFLDFKQTYTSSAIKSYATSLKKGDNFFLKKWSIYDDLDNLYTNKDSKGFKAKIYVLTDSFCRSTCWTFVNELKQIPGVTHLGAITTIQSIYSYAIKNRSPSEHFDFFYPTQIRIQPATNLTKTLIPDRLYEDDLKNEPKVINWVLSIIEKDI